MKNKLYKKTKNILALVIVISIFICGPISVYAQYTWPSGYKFRSSESEDPENYFKDVYINGGGMSSTVPLMSTFYVTQQNWTLTGTRCRTSPSPDTSVLFSDSVAESVCPGILNDANPDNTYRDWVHYSYTCNGDVSQDLRVDNSGYRVLGGDTMYGAWSMLFGFLPPVNEENCGSNGSCFVGNAFVVDTRAQNERNPGLLPGFGIKVLKEGPGEVYYFDQIRSMTQAPVSALKPYNLPVLVGSIIPGFLPVATGECDGSLFREQMQGVDLQPFQVGIGYAMTYDWPRIRAILDQHSQELFDAYGAAQEMTGIPCEIFAGIHYAEGGMDPTRSLVDGRSLRGATLRDDALQAASILLAHMQGSGYNHEPFPFTFEGYKGGLTYYNGLGNLNCNTDRENCYTAACGDEYIPTRWRCEGKCSSGMTPFDDSVYAMRYFPSSSGRYDDMDIIFSSDGGPGCQGYSIPNPLPAQGSGALTVAFMIYQFATGANP